ncbi:MAG: LysM peptidoglycan-binding domain-containing protein [Lachnospiraceae bacterium]|nr:LysM peptidoglycan-binding domain-containing protein [Lachnospiraceae bacterium]
MTRARKHVIVITGVILISFFILLGSSIRAFASSGYPEEYHKYYTCITLESGDTLWNLADDYMIDGVMSRQDFMKEVCKLNHISEDTVLRSGDSLAIAYYSTDIK